MYDQVTLSLMTRGLPATRHIARTLDTWQSSPDTWQTARHVVDTWHVDVDDTWQDVAREGSLGRVCREAHEALVEGDLTPYPCRSPTPSSTRCLCGGCASCLSPSLPLSLAPPLPPHPHRHRAQHVARALGFHAPGDREHGLGAFPGGQARSD